MKRLLLYTVHDKLYNLAMRHTVAVSVAPYRDGVYGDCVFSYVISVHCVLFGVAAVSDPKGRRPVLWSVSSSSPAGSVSHDKKQREQK